MNRFFRYKILQIMWTRAKRLFADLNGPRERELRHRAFFQTQTQARQIMDGVVRGSGDPDSVVRPQESERREQAARVSQAQQEMQRRWAEGQRQQGHGPWGR
jgi:hypothetical protein